MSSFTSKVAEMHDQKSCNHNENSADKACEKPSGGESCAFDGSYIVLNPIRDAAHLVHGSIACCGHSYEGRGSLSSGSKMYRNGFTTDLSELDIIYGAENKLEQAIDHIAKRYSPSAIFVYSTCIPGVTGENIEDVSLKAQQRLKLPVIPVNAPGFLGHKNLGNRIAGEALLNYVIGTGEPDEDVSKLPTLNLIGEYNIAGELWDVLPLFQKLGVHVLSKMTGDADYKEITHAHRAKASLLVCGRALINLAHGLEEKYGIPWKEVSFFGLHNIAEAMRATASLFELSGFNLSSNAEDLISAEEAKTKLALKPYTDFLKGKKAVLYTGGVKSWSMISALNDLGMEVTGVGTKKSSQSDISKITSLVGEERIISDPTPKNLQKIMKETNADILIAGGRNQYMAYKEYIPYIDVNQEKHTPYAGYGGLIELARDIVNTIKTPVWEHVRKPAPWENQQ